jgi:hypothetical protein
MILRPWALPFTLILILYGAGMSNAGETRFFRMCPGAPDECKSPDAFVVALDDTDEINIAKDVVSGKITDRIHVGGRIVAKPVPYNQPWNFYLDPKTIKIMARLPTTCRGYTTTEINANLDRIGKHDDQFLSGGYWCPKGYKISEEIPAK